MVDFSSRKVPVFQGINDIPQAPTLQQAGNGSDLISRYNNLINDVENALNSTINTATSKPSEYHDPYTEVYCNTVTGSDSTGDGTYEAPFASLSKMMQYVRSKIIDTEIYLYADGTFNESINFEGIWAESLEYIFYPQIYVEFGGNVKPTQVNIPDVKGFNLGQNPNIEIYLSFAAPTQEGESGIYLPGPIANFNCRAYLKFQKLTAAPVNNNSVIGFFNSFVSLRGVRFDAENSIRNFIYAENSLIEVNAITEVNNMDGWCYSLWNSKLELMAGNTLNNVYGLIRAQHLSTVVKNDLLHPVFVNNFDSDTSVVNRSSDLAIKPTTKTYELTKEALANGTYYLTRYIPYACKITKLIWGCTNGTASLQIVPGSESAINLSTNIISSTQKVEELANPHPLTSGLDLKAIITNNSSATGFYLIVITEET